MTVQESDDKFFGQFCTKCGALVIAGEACENCGERSSASSDTGDSLELSVNLSVLNCVKCNRIYSIGTSTCPGCGVASDPSDPVNPADGPLNRAKLVALGDLLPNFQALVVTQGDYAPSVRVTGEQFVTYINRNDVYSPELLIGNLKLLVRSIDVSSEVSAHSPTTRTTFEAILDATRELRTIFDELHGVQVPGQLSELHRHTIAAFEAAIDLHVNTARAVLALTVEELQNSERELQASLDRLTVIGGLLAEQIKDIDPGLVDSDRIQQRLRTFIQNSGDFQHDGQPDFAAVVVEKLSGGQSFTELGQEGSAFFGRMLTVNAATLPPETGFALYVLFAQVAASDDPITLRRWSNVLLDVLRATGNW